MTGPPSFRPPDISADVLIPGAGDTNARPIFDMRILWITPGFAADERDRNCIPPLQLLALELLRKGIDLQIVALEYPFRSEPNCWHGAAVFPCNGQNRRWLKPRTLWQAMRFCRRIIREKKVDAVHSFWLGWASRAGERTAKRHGILHITTLMGQDVMPGNGMFLRGLSAERCARLVALSRFQNDIFEKNSGFRAGHVVPWGLPEDEIPSGLPAERPLDVLGVGSLVPVKNWEKWFRTLALVARAKPGIRAEIIGEGPERRRLEALTSDLGLTGSVRFAGNLPRADVLARMREARVLLHTADFESFGYVLAEAAMNGCRIVGTPVGVAAELGATAENEGELARLLLHEVSQPVKNQPFVPFRMEDTAASYLERIGVA